MEVEEDDGSYTLEFQAELVCRICLREEEGLRKLFCSEIIEGRILTLPKIFQEVLQIKISKNDSLPQNICPSCRTKIIDFYQFRRKSHESAKVLHQVLKLDYDFHVGGKLAVPSNPKTNKETQTEELKLKTEAPDPEELFYLGAEFAEFFSNLSPYEDQLKSGPFANVYDLYASKKTSCGLCSEELGFSFLLHRHMKAEHSDLLAAMRAWLSENVMDHDNDQSDDFIEITPAEEAPEARLPELTPLKSAEAEPEEEANCNTCNFLYRGAEIEGHRRFHSETIPVLLSKVEFFMCYSCNGVFMGWEGVVGHAQSPTCHVPLDSPVERFDEAFLDSGVASGCTLGVFQKTSKFEDERCLEVIDEETFLETQKFHCTTCFKSFATILDIKCHLLTHSSNLGCPFEECGAQNGSLKALLQHIRRFHKRTKTEHACHHCHESFPDYRTLMSHLGSECAKRVLRCDFCDRKFFNEAAKTNHEKTHSRRMDASCKICEEQFQSTSELQAHLRTHKEEKPYKCDVCEKKFRTPSHRNDHQNTHKTTREVQCSVCEKFFKSERVMRAHMKIHTGRRYSCPVCKKLFTRRYHVKLHLTTHGKQENAPVKTE